VPGHRWRAYRADGLAAECRHGECAALALSWKLLNNHNYSAKTDVRVGNVPAGVEILRRKRIDAAEKLVIVHN
jgi:hypothetical protein